jgi:hypothetical protein
MRQVLSYIRVSTGKQCKSGLGMEAQREAISFGRVLPEDCAEPSSPNLHIAGSHIEIGGVRPGQQAILR